MKLKLNLAWKIVVSPPETGIDYNLSSKHFNKTPSKTFIKKMGGTSSLDFYPNTFNPTNVFYNAIEPFKLKNGFFGKKFPYKGRIVGASDEKNSIGIKIHQFSSELVILSISVSQIDFAGEVEDLKDMMLIETHTELYELARVISSIISSGGVSSDPIERTLKSYPYIELSCNDSESHIEDIVAVELLTRHKNPKLEIIRSVISKNSDHQLDENSILIDRQGILAIYISDIEDNEQIQRKFEGSHYLFELAVAIYYILEKDGFDDLKPYQRDSISKIIKKPGIVFTKSVTSLKTWQLLIIEFKLKELYDFVAPSNTDVVEIPPGSVASNDIEPEKWSDFQKWKWGLFGAFLLAVFTWAKPLIEEYNPFSHKAVTLFYPEDGAEIDAKNVNFKWKDQDITNVKKYILSVDQYGKNSWAPIAGGGRYVASTASYSLDLKKTGSFRWKIAAKNHDEKKISETNWYYFKLSKKQTTKTTN